MSLLSEKHFSFKCPMNWDEMEVSGAGRHCHKCQKQVFDLTNCSIDEVIALQRKHGPICGSIKVAVAAISLSAAACSHTSSSQVPGNLDSKVRTVDSNVIAGGICPPDELEKMK